MVISTDHPPFDFPVHVLHKKGTPNKTLAVLLAINTCLIVGNYFLQKKAGAPQLDLLTMMFAVAEVALVIYFWAALKFSASLTIDKNGIESEYWGDRKQWSWLDIADVKVEMVRRHVARGVDIRFVVKVLTRNQAAQDESWASIWDGGLNKGRLEATIRKGIQIWGRADRLAPNPSWASGPLPPHRFVRLTLLIAPYLVGAYAVWLVFNFVVGPLIIGAMPHH